VKFVAMPAITIAIKVANAIAATRNLFIVKSPDGRLS
jgi:hypothetical protein